MGDFLQSVYDDFKTRIESPLAFSLFLSWVFWNSDFVWFLLLDESHGKYHQIVEWNFSFWKFWIFPLLTAPFLIVSIPAANNLLMLYRYKLLSSFQHKVQESKGKYNAALELVVLQRKIEELEFKTEELNDNHAEYVNAKLQLDNDKADYEIKIKLNKDIKNTDEFINWPTFRAAYESKFQRLEQKNFNNTESVANENVVVLIGSFVTLSLERLKKIHESKTSIVEGYVDELIITGILPTDIANILLGKKIGDYLNCNYSFSPDDTAKEQCRIEVLYISRIPLI